MKSLFSAAALILLASAAHADIVHLTGSGYGHDNYPTAACNKAKAAARSGPALQCSGTLMEPVFSECIVGEYEDGVYWARITRKFLCVVQ